VDGLCAKKREDVGLIVRAVSFHDFHRISAVHSHPATDTDERTERRTDRQTTCSLNSALFTEVHSAVKTMELKKTDCPSSPNID